MRIVRFMSGGKTYLGKEAEGNSAYRIDGELLAGPAGWKVTDQKLPIEKRLAPLVPQDILCIGLNYREHAAESGSAISRRIPSAKCKRRKYMSLPPF